jgi:hypothetical protein
MHRQQLTTWLLLVSPSLIAFLMLAPWRQKNCHLSRHLGFAPIWSHRFHHIPGAAVDRVALMLVLAVTLVLAAAICCLVG